MYKVQYLKQLFIIILFFFYHVTNAQNIEREVVATSGKFVTNANHQLHFTIGEPIIGLVSNPSNNISQGFWNVSSTITLSENDFSLENIRINVYPNPVQNQVRIVFDKTITQDYQLLLFDVNGRVIKKNKLTKGNTKTQIKMSDLSAGTYYLNIHQNNTKKRITYKLIKE